eukprot:s7463_g4.t1
MQVLSLEQVLRAVVFTARIPVSCCGAEVLQYPSRDVRSPLTREVGDQLPEDQITLRALRDAKETKSKWNIISDLFPTTDGG